MINVNELKDSYQEHKKRRGEEEKEFSKQQRKREKRLKQEMEALEDKIEEYVDNEIESLVRIGEREINISSNTQDTLLNEKFKKLWCDESLPKDRLKEVRQSIISKYEKVGFVVREVNYGNDEWTMSPGLMIIIPEELLEYQMSN